MLNSVAAQIATSTPESITRHAESLVAASRAAIAQLVHGDATGEDLLEEFDELKSHLDDTRWLAGTITHCHPDQAMRAAAEAAEQAVDKVTAEISLDTEVYQRLRSIDATELDPATQHYLRRILREFRRSGVDKDDRTRARLREIREELVSIGQSFQRNISTDSRSVMCTVDELAGLPEDFLRGHPPQEGDGQVRISTDWADSIPFMIYAHSSRARERLWRQCNLRGHPQNIEVLRRMLTLRQELATLLGYPSWAQYATEDKMIGSADAVGDFIAQMSHMARDREAREFALLLERKRVDDPTATEIHPWDYYYLEDRIKAERFAFDSQQMRPYFEYSRVKRGLMALAERLFGISFQAREDMPVWHDEVEVYDVLDGEAVLGRIFLDMHPREGKFGHAAIHAITGGKAGRRIPECVLFCNFARPGDKPALLQHHEVTMFFHEFGHLLHHVFAGHQRWAGNTRSAGERDFTEAPSQLLEEWIRDPRTLSTFARHYETGEVLPAELVTQLRAAEEFGKGALVRRHMFYADLSLELHRRDPATADPLQTEVEVWERHAPSPHADGAWIHLSFNHLVGYSAVYYSYMWSLAIAKDLLTGFDPADLLARPAATRYRETVLAPGGSTPAAQLVRDFLGRDYTFDAFRSWLDSDG